MAPNSVNYLEKIPKQRGRCTSCLCMSWKVFTCIFSHVMLISLVIAYCLFGSYAFEYLEAENERNVSKINYYFWSRKLCVLRKQNFFFHNISRVFLIHCVTT